METVENYREINWGPFATNILDHLGDQNLILSDGTHVYLNMGMTSFTLQIGDQKWISQDNISISYLMNAYGVGIRTK